MASSKFRDHQIKNLVLKLRTLLPQLNHKFDDSKVYKFCMYKYFLILQSC